MGFCSWGPGALKYVRGEDRGVPAASAPGGPLAGLQPEEEKGQSMVPSSKLLSRLLAPAGLAGLLSPAQGRGGEKHAASPSSFPR